MFGESEHDCLLKMRIFVWFGEVTPDQVSDVIRMSSVSRILTDVFKSDLSKLINDERRRNRNFTEFGMGLSLREVLFADRKIWIAQQLDLEFESVAHLDQIGNQTGRNWQNLSVVVPPEIV